MDLNHLHLHVRDQVRSQRFYRSYFRFRKHSRLGEVLFLRNDHGFALALTQDPKPSRFPRWFHFGFRLDTPQAVRRLHSRMSAAGVPVQSIHEYGEYVTFHCADPDGYAIEVYCE